MSKINIVNGTEEGAMGDRFFVRSDDRATFFIAGYGCLDYPGSLKEILTLAWNFSVLLEK